MGKQKAKKTHQVVDSNDPDVLKNFGNEQYSKGNYTAAIQYYTKAIGIKPHEIYYSNRAQVYIDLNRNQEAISDCDDAIKCNPEWIKAYLRKGLALININDLQGADELALNAFRQGIEIARKNQTENEDIIETLTQLIQFAEQELSLDRSIPLVHPERQRFNDLFSWMKSGGAQFDKLKLRYYSADYRGVHAQQNIQKGETILYVPQNQLLTLDMAMISPIGSLMAARNFRQRLLSPKHSFLATFVMEEKRRENSQFQKFIDILPKGFTNFPIFYTKEEREWLIGSPFQAQITDKIKDIQQDYQLICKEVSEYQQFPLKEYSEYRMMVASRIFGIQINGHKTDAFVAYADMLNHRRPRQTSWQFCDQRQGFIIEALEDIKRGDQIYDSYGKKCNTRFLLNYGFINLNNDGNEFPFKLSLSTSDPYFQAKNDLLGDALSKRTYRVMADLTEESTFKFLSWVRFCEYEGDMMVLIQAKLREEKQRQEASDSEEVSTSWKAENIGVISIQSERALLLRINKLCKEALKLYPQTLLEDEEILAQDDIHHTLTFNLRNCVLFRMGEKEILHWYIEFTEYMISVLGMKFKDAKKETQQLPNQFESIRDYIHQSILPLLLKDQN